MIPVFVIHATHLLERERHIRAQLESAGLQSEWIDRFDVGEITPQVEARYFSVGHDLRRAEMSCALKHVVSWQRIAETGCKLALVVEDDAIFSSGFRRKLERACAEMDAERAEIAYLSCGDNWYVPSGDLVAGRLLHPARKSRTTDVYLITAAAAERRLAWLAENRMNLPVDHALNIIDPEMETRILWADPPLAVQGSLTGAMKSSIWPEWSERGRWYRPLLFRYKTVKRRYIDRWLTRQP